MSKYLAVTDNSCIAIMLMGMALNAQGIADVAFVDISDNGTVRQNELEPCRVVS
jgi:hypothetical protein